VRGPVNLIPKVFGKNVIFNSFVYSGGTGKYNLGGLLIFLIYKSNKKIYI
jgi:hypothetical protein